jgi:hypothetical protein
VRHVPAPRRRRNKKTQFRLDHIRRREIERLARHVGAADTEDLDQYLIIWARHNRQSNDPIWAIRNAALRMGRPNLTDAEASAINQEAAAFYKAMTADDVARELGVTWALRQTLSLKTIGAVNMLKEARKEIRRVRDKVAKEKKRRAAGVQPRAKYEAYSLSATQPWRELGMSRRTWYRRNKQRTGGGTTSSATLLLIADEGLASARPDSSVFLSSSTCSVVLADGEPGAADVHASLPLELRLYVLGLSSTAVPEKPTVITADDPRMVLRMAS